MPASSPQRPSAGPAADARRRRATLIMTVVAALTVLVPFLFWKQTWFGEPLSDEELGQYLADLERPRHIQQALVQIQQRMERGDTSAERWYPQMAALKDSPVVELRVTLAWVLGADNHSGLFHETLLEMLRDKDLLVRRNAALSLVRFGDASGRGEILKLLAPYTVRATEPGLLRYRLDEGTLVDGGTVFARLEKPDGSLAEIRSPLPGRLLHRVAPEGVTVTAGEDVATLAPGEDHVWEALRALLLIGREEDLPTVEAFAHASEADHPARIREQAALTADEIRKRVSGK
ncbi:MAG: HEAT repeat domain-containing protein [Acidobacteria bacterium]|nr:HEAT repeat domain-containing protein [Acidobacteriota bacterium]